MFDNILMGKASPFLILLWKILFYVPSRVYRFFFFLDQKRRKRLRKKLLPFENKPTISIGNITLGGSGKTMVGLSLVKYLVREGMVVAVVLRGYKGSLEREESAVLNEKNYLLAGDEAQLYYNIVRKNKGMVLVGYKKDISWLKAQQESDVVLLDDGFQRSEIPRSLDILCFDAGVGTGNGSLFPAGYLRQPLQDASKADCWFIKNTSSDEFCSKILLNSFRAGHYFFRPVVQYLENLEGERESFESLSGETILCFCAIGNPDSFFSLVHEKIKPQQMYCEFFPDHYDYTPHSLRSLEEKYSHCDKMLCTSKDFAKIYPLRKQISGKLQKKLYFLGIDIKIYASDSRGVEWGQIIGPGIKNLDNINKNAI